MAPTSANTDADHYATQEARRRLWADKWLDVFMAGAWASGEPPLPPPIDQQFDCYHPFCCFSCKRGAFTGGTKLSTCTSCRVVKYCSREHQKKDWKNHKVWCKAFASFRESGDADYLALQKPTDMTAWRHHTNLLSVKVNSRVGARLHTTEVQLVALQPRCRKCLVAGCSKDIELIPCPRCTGVALCRDCYSDAKDANEYEKFHGSGDHGIMQCDQYIVALSCTGMVVEQGSPLCIESDSDMEECFQPNDWGDYLEKKRGDFKDVPPSTPMMLMAPVVAFVTDGLSLPLTILFSLGQPAVLGKDKVPSLTRLVVHVVGASVIEELGVSKFLELTRLLPALEYLRIVSIGPDIEELVVDFPPEGRPLNFVDPTGSHIREGCDARIQRRRGYYHDVAKDLDEAPTLIVAAHAGIHDAIYTESWRPTIEQIASREVPFVVTGYNEKEVQADRHCLEGFGSKIVVGPAANPFRGLRPFLDPMRDPSDFIFSNSHLVVCRGSR